MRLYINFAETECLHASTSLTLHHYNRKKRLKITHFATISKYADNDMKLCRFGNVVRTCMYWQLSKNMLKEQF